MANNDMTRLKIVPVLAGGGTRLSAHLGALMALEELDVEFNHIVATSGGGSIIAALYSAGFPLSQLTDIVYREDFSQFRKRSLVEFFPRGRLSSGRRFEKWLDDLLRGSRFCNLEKELQIIIPDVRNSQPVVFNRTETPYVNVARAVRFSMGVPLLFSFQEYGNHLLVDGSILSEDALHRDWARNDRLVGCFRLRSDKMMAPLRPWWLLANYAQMRMRTFLVIISRVFVDHQYWPRTIIINTASL